MWNIKLILLRIKYSYIVIDINKRDIYTNLTKNLYGFYVVIKYLYHLLINNFCPLYILS